MTDWSGNLPLRQMPKIVDHQQKKQQIAAVATQLFIDKGYAGCGMREIAASLGISKTQMYHYFASKEVLFQYCIQGFLDAASGYALQLTPQQTLTEKLHILLDYYDQAIPLFRQELYLVMEYLRSAGNAAKDPLLANYQHSLLQTFMHSLCINSQQAIAVQQQLMGAMLIAVLGQAPLPKAALHSSLMRLLA